MQTSFWKKNAANIWIVVGFLLLSFAYCLPQIKGQKLNVHDSRSWEAASQEARAYKEATNIDPLWSNSMFGGMPTYTYYLSGVKNYVVKAQQAIEKVIPNPAFLFFLTMLGFFIFGL